MPRAMPGLLCDGSSGCYASSPDSAAISITGDLTVRAIITMLDLVPTGTRRMVAGRMDGGGTDWSWGLFIAEDLTIGCFVGSSGVAVTELHSTAASSLQRGYPLSVQFDWRASDGRVRFYQDVPQGDGSITIPQGTQLGTDQTAALGSLFDATGPLQIGARGTGGNTERFIGIIHHVQIFSAGPSSQYNAFFSRESGDYPSFPEWELSATVTLNGTAHIGRPPQPFNFQSFSPSPGEGPSGGGAAQYPVEGGWQ